MNNLPVKKDYSKENLKDINKIDGIVTVAIDQSSSISGYSIFSNGELVQYGLFKTSKKESPEFRIIEVSDFLSSLICRLKPSHVALEDVQYQSNPRTLILLSKLLGILQYTCIKSSIEHTIIKPGTWKKTCGVKGRARKEQKNNNREFIKNTFNINVSEDESDAISINYHLNRKELKNGTD